MFVTLNFSPCSVTSLVQLFFCNGPFHTRTYTRIHTDAQSKLTYNYFAISLVEHGVEHRMVDRCLIGRSFVTKLASFLDILTYVCMFMCTCYIRFANTRVGWKRNVEKQATRGDSGTTR